MNDIEREIFARSTPDRDALLACGFAPDGDALRFFGEIADNEFQVEVSVLADGSVSSRVIDAESGDEYLPIFAEAHVGAYVGRVREEYAAFLRRIAEQCFVRAPFSSPQANRLAAHIAAAYGEREDRPFDDDADVGVFRSPQTNKWYAIIMPVKKGVLAGEKGAPDADRRVEVINVKAKPEDIPALTEIAGVYPAYHMNRKHWISVLLDGTLDDATLFELVAVSRSFAVGRPLDGASYIVPSSPRDYDVDAHFEREGDILWHQPKSVQIGDSVYLYYGAPVSAVRWKCEVLAVSQSGERYDDPRPQMLLRPVLRYDDAFCTFAKLGELGIRAVRGTRRATEDFVRYMEGYEKE